jgi:hypothetical protein
VYYVRLLLLPHTVACAVVFDFQIVFKHFTVQIIQERAQFGQVRPVV